MTAPARPGTAPAARTGPGEHLSVTEKLSLFAPRPGGLSGGRGAVPTPYGQVRVDAAPVRVRIDSPVEVDVLHPDGSVTRHPAGASTVALSLSAVPTTTPPSKPPPPRHRRAEATS
ncbi:hypothetical protein [Streptomyces yanii]|uniref:Uncharacterized protein n=1 Tax=Streptomyces yanii TaxID=78510 RepID=A0ABV5R348_9ACTN